MIENKNIDISIVIPLYNERDSLKELYEWIKKSLINSNLSYEIIFVDDGSNDDSWRIIKEISVEKNIKGIKFRRNYGKSAALNVGFKVAQGDVVITMDADLQDSPDEILGLYKMIIKDNYDIVSGWKKKRKDPLSKTIPTKLFNWATRKISGIYLHDFNCGLKAYKNNVVKSIEVYGEMHRYIPVIAKWAGFKNIGEKIVTHYPRKYGKSKFGFERFINGFLDLISISFITRFGRRPMHFFGTIGVMSFFIGGIITAIIIGEKIYKLKHHLAVRDVTDQPLFYLALTMIIVGTQLFVSGFLGELVSRTNPDRNNYLIAKKINL